MRRELETRARQTLKHLDRFNVPRHLRENWRPMPSVDPVWDARLERSRTCMIPWLDRQRALADSRVLEVGGGGGASTMALAEQGGRVVAIDVSDKQVALSHERLAPHGLDLDVRVHDGAKLDTVDGDFDWIIFWACLEHMTLDERQAALKAAWRKLPSRGLLTLVETPNRLWPYDSHTSKLPFFNWLPDQLACAYAPFSKRSGFNDPGRYNPSTDMETFYRAGRGVSFHEFDLAFGDHLALDVVGSMQGERRDANPLRGMSWKMSSDGAVERVLRAFSPTSHSAWFQPMLYLTLRRP